MKLSVGILALAIASASGLRLRNGHRQRNRDPTTFMQEHSAQCETEALSLCPGTEVNMDCVIQNKANLTTTCQTFLEYAMSMGMGSADSGSADSGSYDTGSYDYSADSGSYDTGSYDYSADSSDYSAASGSTEKESSNEGKTEDMTEAINECGNLVRTFCPGPSSPAESEDLYLLNCALENLVSLPEKCQTIAMMMRDKHMKNTEGGEAKEEGKAKEEFPPKEVIEMCGREARAICPGTNDDGLLDCVLSQLDNLSGECQMVAKLMKEKRGDTIQKEITKQIEALWKHQEVQGKMIQEGMKEVGKAIEQIWDHEKTQGEQVQKAIKQIWDHEKTQGEAIQGLVTEALNQIHNSLRGAASEK